MKWSIHTQVNMEIGDYTASGKKLQLRNHMSIYENKGTNLAIKVQQITKPSKTYTKKQVIIASTINEVIYSHTSEHGDYTASGKKLQLRNQVCIYENKATNLAIKVRRLQYNTQTQTVNTTEYTWKTLNLILTSLTQTQIPIYLLTWFASCNRYVIFMVLHVITSRLVHSFLEAYQHIKKRKGNFILIVEHRSRDWSPSLSCQQAGDIHHTWL